MIYLVIYTFSSFQISKKISALNPAIELYTAFTKCIVNEQQSKNCLPLLKYIVENGNTTIYEWNFGEPPLSIEPDPIHIELDVEETADINEVILHHLQLFYPFVYFTNFYSHRLILVMLQIMKISILVI